MNKKSRYVQVMGILNVTPDSFSDGGDFFDARAALARAKEMVKEGVDIIDIGGQSTRPGAEIISVDEELRRVVPVVKAVRKALPLVPISVDTNRAIVAEAALHAGATMINSLGGFHFDEMLAGVVAKARCPIVIYHIKGEPASMQKGTITYKNVVRDVDAFFAEQIAIGTKYGVKKNQYILDPGIGFGKSDEHNIKLIREFGYFLKWKLPLLIGVSRKSHLGRIMQTKLGLKKMPLPTERIEAGLAEVAIMVQNGASIVRTHDVLATKKFLAVLLECI